jgi:hypothetical protein
LQQTGPQQVQLEWQRWGLGADAPSQQSYSSLANGFLMHTPPQHLWVVPSGQHWLPQHVWPAGQDLHEPSRHGTVPSGQRQLPPEQVLPPVHLLPQAPQLLLSFPVFTHVPPHGFWPAGHLQTPEEHDAPLGHLVPHPLQLIGSLWVLTQICLQSVSPEAHILMHWPFWQDLPASQ